jgi:hypothetical protein
MVMRLINNSWGPGCYGVKEILTSMNTGLIVHRAVLNDTKYCLSAHVLLTFGIAIDATHGMGNTPNTLHSTWHVLGLAFGSLSRSSKLTGNFF